MKLEIKQGHLKNQLLLPGLMIYMTLATQKVIQNKIKNHNEYDLHLIAKYVSTSWNLPTPFTVPSHDIEMMSCKTWAT